MPAGKSPFASPKSLSSKATRNAALNALNPFRPPFGEALPCRVPLTAPVVILHCGRGPVLTGGSMMGDTHRRSRFRSSMDARPVHPILMGRRSASAAGTLRVVAHRCGYRGCRGGAGGVGGCQHCHGLGTVIRSWKQTQDRVAMELSGCKWTVVLMCHQICWTPWNAI